MTLFPSKVLLFGEYSIISGSAALAIPYYKYSGKWSYAPINTPTALASQKALAEILKAFKSTTTLTTILDLNQLEQALEKGLWFDSTIPPGYGLGSSGALTAALYQCFGQKKVADLRQQKQLLAEIEHSFHGKSSGIDPLVSYAEQPILITPQQYCETVSIQTSSSDYCFFLLNTQNSRKTPPLVAHFMQLSEQANFETNCLTPMAAAVNNCIEQLIAGTWESLFTEFQNISRLQSDYFQKMILPQHQSIVENGLQRDSSYALKLCGAGGGGFMLGISKDWIRTQQVLEPYEIERISPSSASLDSHLF